MTGRPGTNQSGFPVPETCGLDLYRGVLRFLATADRGSRTQQLEETGPPRNSQQGLRSRVSER